MTPAAQRYKPKPPLPERLRAALHEIFNGDGQKPAQTNATLVRLHQLHALKRIGAIEYEEIPGFKQRYGVQGWDVVLTELGLKLYP